VIPTWDPNTCLSSTKSEGIEFTEFERYPINIRLDINQTMIILF
jgi:hypothetical protein